MILKLKLSNNVFYKKCGPKLIFFNEKKIERFGPFLTWTSLSKSGYPQIFEPSAGTEFEYILVEFAGIRTQILQRVILRKVHLCSFQG